MCVIGAIFEETTIIITMLVCHMREFPGHENIIRSFLFLFFQVSVKRSDMGKKRGNAQNFLS